MNRTRRTALAACCVLLSVPLLTLPAEAGVEIYRDGDRYVEVGGVIQLQYDAFDPAGGSDTAGDGEDDVRFRRLRPYVEASVTEDWFGKIEVDFGQAIDGNEVAVKDAYVRWTGSDRVTVTVGNQKPPFSREFLTSSKEQQLVERTFTGDHNYGSPDRMLGVRLDGGAGKTFDWAASFGAASLDPDAGKIDFDSPVTGNDDFNEGWLAVGRLEYSPFGRFKPTQGDLGRSAGWKLAFATAAFTWSNDGDNDTYTAGGTSTSASRADLDAADGFELSAGLRGYGFSADAQYQSIDADTVDGAFSGGLFVAGTTTLEQLTLEAGYTLVPERFEIVAGWETQDADGYHDAWNRTSLGVNWFLDGHKLKGQLTWRMGENLDGVPGADADEIFAQFQLAF